jgi:hypothetical protein
MAYRSRARTRRTSRGKRVRPDAKLLRSLLEASEQEQTSTTAGSVHGRFKGLKPLVRFSRVAIRNVKSGLQSCIHCLRPHRRHELGLVASR